MHFERELEAARRVAVQAGEAALARRRAGLTAEAKQDLSPVTAADREGERLIAAAFEAAFPEDGLLGEEGALKPSRSRRTWIIDPVDGTREFVRGNPAWAVLIGLECDREVVLGVSHFPELQTTYAAVRGEGAWRNESRICVSSVQAPGQAVLCFNGLNTLASHPFAGRLLGWLERFWAVRSMGGCLDAVLLAEGKVDAWIEPKAEPWDLAALKILLEEAGARFFNFDGRGSIYGGNCAACVPALEHELREFLGCL